MKKVFDLIYYVIFDVSFVRCKVYFMRCSKLICVMELFLWRKVIKIKLKLFKKKYKCNCINRI